MTAQAPITPSRSTGSLNQGYIGRKVVFRQHQSASSPKSLVRKQTPMWSVAAVLAIVLIMCQCSEAFASERRRSFLLGGGSVYTSGYWGCRGGATPVASSTTEYTSRRNNNNPPLTCTMQLPPQLNASPLSSSSSSGDAYKKTLEKKHQKHVNGASKPTSTSPSSDTDSTSPKDSSEASEWGNSNNIFDPVEDVITAVEYVAETKLPTDVGQFQLRAYRVPGAPRGRGYSEPCVIYSRDKPPFGGGSGNGAAGSIPVRIHDQCLTSEVFRSQRYEVLKCI